MPNRPRERPFKSPRRFVLGAFVLIGTLAAVRAWSAGFEIARTASNAVRVAHQADRSTYLVGEVAHRVDDVSAALDEQAGEDSIGAAKLEVGKDLERLDTAMRDLPNFLDEEDMSTFAEIVPRIASFRQSVGRVVAASGSRYTKESRRIFEQQVLPTVAALEAPLDRLIDLNAAESTRRIAQLERDLDAFRRREIVLGFIFVGILVLVAVSTLRTIDKQDRAVAGHLSALNQANRDLDAFAARVAHDLRGPLAPIAVSAARLRSANGDQNQIDRAAARIAQSADRANTLIESLLAFSRAGALQDDRSSAFAPEVVGRALEAIHDTAAEANVTLSSDVAPMWVGIDGSLLEQVLDNLLSNAIRYLGARPTRCVAIRAEPDGNVARFEVTDTGPGVPNDARGRIFEPFFRLEPQLRGGAGLGLATAKRIVESRGGDIGVGDAPEGGARFWFTVPLRSAPMARREQAA